LDKTKAAGANKLAVMKMDNLVLNMAVPLMLSMVVQALYNVVDSLFVSHITSDTVANAGDKAVLALTLAFPLQMLMTAINVGTGVGLNSLVSRHLGMKDREGASVVAGNGFFLGFCLSALMMFIGGVFGRAYIASQTSDPVVLADGTTYVHIITLLSLGSMLYFSVEKMLPGTGHTVAAMVAQLAGAVTNIILDPLFIFGIGPFPEWGVKGAAVATVIGQFVSMFTGLYVFFFRITDVDKGLRYLKPDWKVIGQIYKVGFPAIIMSGFTSVMSYGMNLILRPVGDAAVAAFGIYYKLQNFIFMACYGLNNALIAIVGYSFGARRKDRIQSALKCGMVDSFVIMGVGILLMWTLAPTIVKLFGVSEETLRLAALALRIISCGWLFAGFNIIIQGFYQALGNGIYSLIISMLRMAVVLLPLAWLLTKSSHASTVVWIAFPVAELSATICALFMYRAMDKKVLSQLPEPTK